MTDTKSWRDDEGVDNARRLATRGALDKTLGLMALSVIDNRAAYDAGFEAGVLATEAGVGRSDE